MRGRLYFGLWIFSPQSLAPLILGLWEIENRVSRSMWQRLLTSWWTWSTEGGRERLVTRWNLLKCTLGDLLLAARPYLLKVPSPPKITPPVEDQAFSTQVFKGRFISKPFAQHTDRVCNKPYIQEIAATLCYLWSSALAPRHLEGITCLRAGAMHYSAQSEKLTTWL